jgi:hypothetical protein
MSGRMTIECEVRFQTGRRGRKRLEAGAAEAPVCEAGRVPRLVRLLALAHRLEGLLRQGVVRDYAELGRLGGVTRARVSQVMNLLLLAPDLQEPILFLPRTLRGRDPLILADLQPICLVPDWKVQRRLFEQLGVPAGG